MTGKPDWAWHPRAHDRFVAVETTGYEAEAPEQGQRTDGQIGFSVAGPRSREVRGPPQFVVRCAVREDHPLVQAISVSGSPPAS